MAILGGCEFAIRFAYGLDGDCMPFTFWFSWSLGAFIADAYLKEKPLPFTKVPVIPLLILIFVSYFFKATIAFLFPLAAITTAILMSRLLSERVPQIQMPAMPLTALKKIGIWSYSIYLLHQPLLMSYNISLTRIFPNALQSGPVAMCVMLLCWLPIICFAFLWFKVFELPSISAGKFLVEKFDGMNLAARPAKKSGGLKFAAIFVALILFAAGNFFIESKLTHIDLVTNPTRELAR